MGPVVNAMAILVTLGITIISANVISPTPYALEFEKMTSEWIDLAGILPEMTDLLQVQRNT